MDQNTQKLLEFIKKLDKKIKKLEKRVHLLENNTLNNSGKNKKNNGNNVKNIVIKNNVIKNNCSVIISKYDNGIVVSGDTYDIRQIINKKYKGWWTPEKKGWTVRLNFYSNLVADIKKNIKSVKENTINETLNYIENSSHDFI